MSIRLSSIGVRGSLNMSSRTILVPMKDAIFLLVIMDWSKFVSKCLDQSEMNLEVERCGLLLAAEHAHLDVLKLLLDANDRLEITEDLIVHLARAGDTGRKALEFLCNGKRKVDITKHVISKVAEVYE